MEDTASAGNETSKANCTNDYCVSDEQYLDMIRDYIRKWGRLFWSLWSEVVCQHRLVHGSDAERDQTFGNIT